MIFGCSTANARCWRNRTVASCCLRASIFLDFGVARRWHRWSICSTVSRKRARQIGVSLNAIASRSFFGCSNSTGVFHWRERVGSRAFRPRMWHPREIGKVRRVVAPSQARECGFRSRKALGDIRITACYGNGESPRLSCQLRSQTLVCIQTRLPQNLDRPRNINSMKKTLSCTILALR